MKQIQITKVENGYVVVVKETVKGVTATKTYAYEEFRDVVDRLEVELG